MKDFLDNVIAHAVEFDCINSVLLVPKKKSISIATMTDKTIRMMGTTANVELIDSPLCIGNVGYLSKLLLKLNTSRIEVEKGTSLEGMEVIKYIFLSNDNMTARYVATDPKIFKSGGVVDLSWSEPLILTPNSFELYKEAYDLYRMVDSDSKQVNFLFTGEDVILSFGEDSHNIDLIFTKSDKEMPDMLFRSDRLRSIMSLVYKDGGGMMYFNDKAMKVETTRDGVNYTYVLPKMTRSRM